MTLRSLDLNLFRVFQAVMQHRSVSAAARELDLTSSAVSHALSRLRKALDDDLFVAGPTGMEPTPRALDLAPNVSDGMQRLFSALEAKPFSAKTAIRTFGIAASDYPATAMIPPLVSSLVRKAPNVTLRAFPVNRMDTVRLLDEARIDLVLGWFDDVPARMCRTTIAMEEEALVVRAGHPLTQGEVTKRRLLGFSYVVVELTGSEGRGAGGFIDDRGVLRRVWSERLLIESGERDGPVGRIAVTVPSYGPVPLILESTDLVATLPRRLALQAARTGAVVLLDLPYAPLQVKIEAIWHQRADGDPAVRWLIGEIAEVMRAPETA